MRQEISAGGIVFHAQNAQHSILVLRDMNNNWTFPKGLVDPGETLEHAAFREIGEETGITQIKLLAPLGTINYMFTRKEPIYKTVNYYLFSSESQEKLMHQAAEGIREARWMPYKELVHEIGYKETNLPLLTLAYQRFNVLCDTG